MSSCVRGDQCLFAHGEGDLVPVALKGYQEVNSNFRAGLPTAVSKVLSFILREGDDLFS